MVLFHHNFVTHSHLFLRRNGACGALVRRKLLGVISLGVFFQQKQNFVFYFLKNNPCQIKF